MWNVLYWKERFLERHGEKSETVDADLRKSELSLALLGDDGCGYVPALPPDVAKRFYSNEYLNETSSEVFAL